VAVTLMAAVGLTDPLVGLVAGSILLITTNVGGDMQQDRSTGWRLGTNRMVQFRYQVIGIVMGALLAVYVAKLFLAAYPVLTIDTFAHPEQKAANWQSAMTYKLVGVLRGLTSADPTSLKLMLLGIAIGFATEGRAQAAEGERGVPVVEGEEPRHAGGRFRRRCDSAAEPVRVELRRVRRLVRVVLGRPRRHLLVGLELGCRPAQRLPGRRRKACPPTSARCRCSAAA
jgi:uncharacterized membrane protein